MTNIPIGNPGVAGDSFENFRQDDFLLSDEPGFFTQDMVLAVSQDIALYEVVGVNGSGQIIPAVSGTTEAIGVAAGAITSDGASNPTIQVIRGGHLNGDKLVWDATYNTDALKQAAFETAPAPTQIVVAFNKYNRAP